jgi:hypothetical protein
MMMMINHIYQEVLVKTVEVKYINTHNQVVDILTKPLTLEQYAVLSDRLLRGFNGVPVTHESNLGKLKLLTRSQQIQLSIKCLYAYDNI